MENYQQRQSQHIQYQPQHVVYTQPSSSARVTFNRDYLLSIAGIVRWILIVKYLFLIIGATHHFSLEFNEII